MLQHQQKGHLASDVLAELLELRMQAEAMQVNDLDCLKLARFRGYGKGYTVYGRGYTEYTV